MENFASLFTGISEEVDDEVLDNLEISAVDGILLDLGVSSLQLDDPQRGFSLRVDGPLDMRMDQNAHISAYDLVNSLSEKEIVSILKDFGQERWAYRIARKIVDSILKTLHASWLLRRFPKSQLTNEF